MSAQDMRTDFDPVKAEAFAGRLLGALNNAALCLMASVGHRTGLFDVMRTSPPATSQEIADLAGLNERYVREWLGAMVTGRVVDVEPTTLRFSLPAEHAAFLTRKAAADNMAVFAQYVAIMGGVEDDIVECFRKGGGVPYSRQPWGRGSPAVSEEPDCDRTVIRQAQNLEEHRGLLTHIS